METIKVVIDKDGMKAQLGLTDAQLDQLSEVCVSAVTAAVMAKWQAIAKRDLRSTAPEYVNNIISVDKGRFEKQVVLTGVLPNMIESGASAFDMKDGFKKSAKVKYTIPTYKTVKGSRIMLSAGGAWYLTIPFRIGTPSALGQAGFSSVMPDAVYNAMRQTHGNVLRATEVPSPYNTPKTRAAIDKTATNKYYAAYTHKTSIYAGMIRYTAQYGKTYQNTYGTFRRAGENSDPDSWIHKGLVARNFMGKAKDAVEGDLEVIINNEVLDFLETIL